MSIDAKIVGITWLPTGEARLALEQEDLSRVAGQETLSLMARSMLFS